MSRSTVTTPQRRHPRLPLALLLAALPACGLFSKDVEGDEAGECSDGADNNQDGYFDCDDQGCWGSPDCQGDGAVDGGGDGGGTDGGGTDGGGSDGGGSDGGGTDGGGSDGGGSDGGGTDSGGDDGSVVDELQDWTHYTLTMQVDWYFNPVSGFEDCSLRYAGEGDRIDGEGSTLWFDGSYTRESTCTNHDVLAGGFPWYSPSTNEAIVGLVFSGDAATWEEWFADTTQAPGGFAADWWMFDMAAPFYAEAGYASHFESYEDSSGYFLVTYDVELQLE
ncbi:MAG: hypothetical protein H6742_04380 [Alphaproteobacteria bacterium]|nr:hypothetical protein [Alphaproteobacteria bacterium]